MSENFDKEAERERLREKYEADQGDREATERMSELLLQGATMTNKHCDTCGSPIFRYQGQEFCPTCQAEGQPAAESQPESEDSSAEPGVGASTGGADPAAGGQVDPGASQVDAGAGQTDPGTEPSQGPGTTAARTATAPGGTPVAAGDAGAQESLSQTIAVLAERARTSEDPQQAKAFLEAAREAAEALAALAGR
ncbi:Sjogren's syndrome/scleroderma autoantigen 1 family protein [Halodesulfurarchaeum sp. HSR-GB]|uniref:Sjogren's syndrome/scleroderma autoantigen 1 family protein n=1 Tax=Halodesulfurarchaeum sp. HSR-GB TaxID=3074077 RepID=UPI00285B76A2|nr:Sjogren's syndrome/scleroderma autoantigen 1 family protein [Halodesulfurarchaeum sp. HSR-GB]MDR5656113.1 Sjogren's syndrome/scleroderma autoantigen 1 family protein [Halodesulfurarchaeum sp. HSR-GB]